MPSGRGEFRSSPTSMGVCDRLAKPRLSSGRPSFIDLIQLQGLSCPCLIDLKVHESSRRQGLLKGEEGHKLQNQKVKRVNSFTQLYQMIDLP